MLKLFHKDRKYLIYLSMKKIRVGVSFFLLIIIALVSGQVLLLTNYFLALLLHELAHLWVAVKNGYSLKLIKMDIFGLSIELNETIDDKDSFKINIAGPLLNLLLCIICMALYWSIPISYEYLNSFCVCNLVLALFNLIPIYPLDGGKIFRGIIKNDKTYKLLDCGIRYSLAVLFICAYVVTFNKTSNLLLVIMAIFFLTSKGKQAPTMSIFKYRQNKHFDKVVILKVDQSEILFNLIKQIKSHHYTIFYVPKLNKYYDEDNIIELSLTNKLTCTLQEIN